MDALRDRLGDKVRRAVLAEAEEREPDPAPGGAGGQGHEPPSGVVEVPIDGVLDLHTFAPRETADVVASYLDECVARGIATVRVIHGKGVGTQRRIVEGVLRRHPAVVSFAPAPAWVGGWGATVVELRVAEAGSAGRGG